MVKIPVYNQKGKKTGEAEVSEAVFGVAMNEALLKQVYVGLAANARSGNAHTKDRGERAGSGIKPWRQKGTGRARTGSVRNPIWRKGGVIFGPTKDRNASKVVPTKMKRQALRVALSEKVRDGKVFVLDSWKLEELKTKHAAGVLKALGIEGSVLSGISKDETETKRAIANIHEASVKAGADVNVVDALHHKAIVLSEAALREVEARLMK